MIDIDEDFMKEFEEMLGDLDDDFGTYSPDGPPPLPKRRYCNHEWKTILLLTSTVYDCKKCGIKKEDV